MKSKYTLLLATVVTILSFVSFSRKTFAAVDITLERDKEVALEDGSGKTGTVYLSIDSNNAYLSGFRITVNYSPSVMIEKEAPKFLATDYCKLTQSTEVNDKDKSFVFLCFNSDSDQEKTLNNVKLLEIPYTVYGSGDTDKTYFYVDVSDDERIFDLAGATAGVITDINKPENTDRTPSTVTLPSDKDDSSIKSFLLEHPWYVIGAIVVILVLIIGIVFLIPDNHSSKGRNKTIEA
ncbi:hypothetical protein J6Z48_03175 [bacterium]|nr:hypothetical protein [bacterium]